MNQVRQNGDGGRGISFANQGKVLVALTRAGVKLLAGTDSPNMPNAVGLHGESGMFVRLGLTPVEALRTATSYAAEALGSGADLGMIEVGEVADIVILDADPLADIRNTRKVKAVVKNGRLFDMKTRLSGTTIQP